LGALSALYDAYRAEVEFIVVYIREAHPEDGWVLTDNRREAIAVHDPETAGERASVAAACAARHALDIPCVVDGIGDEVARRYGGWPDRLYLVGRDGDIAYQGGPGPFGFDVTALESALARETGRRSAANRA
jgi:Iodothyronine deiodinase